MRAGDRSVLLLFRKGATKDTDASDLIYVAFGIARADLLAEENLLAQAAVPIKLWKTWKFGAEALYFCDPDGHLLQMITPEVWSID
jgi:catechol-2,3-dioxygenase